MGHDNWLQFSGHVCQASLHDTLVIGWFLYKLRSQCTNFAHRLLLLQLLKAKLKFAGTVAMEDAIGKKGGNTVAFTTRCNDTWSKSVLEAQHPNGHGPSSGHCSPNEIIWQNHIRRFKREKERKNAWSTTRESAKSFRIETKETAIRWTT